MIEQQIQTRPTHCIFRRGTFWLALPAQVIRKVTPRPVMVAVPKTHPVLAGLCHARGEFIPVLTLDPVLAAKRSSPEELMLIIDDTDGAWGILVDEVDSLAFLESSSAPESDSDVGWTSSVTGWATHERGVVRIIDHVRLRELAERELIGGLPLPAANGDDTSTSHQADANSTVA